MKTIKELCEHIGRLEKASGLAADEYDRNGLNPSAHYEDGVCHGLNMAKRLLEDWGPTIEREIKKQSGE